MNAYEKNVCCAWLAAAMPCCENAHRALHLFGSAEKVYEAVTEHEPVIEELFSPQELLRLRAGATEQKMLIWQETMEKHGICVLTVLDEDYPDELMCYDDPPYLLFYQGDISCFSQGRKLAMVGSRRASYTGLKSAREISKKLALHRVCVISGMAYGIDAASHQGCLDGEGRTIAVLGCGLDLSYPSGNAKLRQAILNGGGLLLSEFAPGDQPLGWHFPYRNRLISGLCQAVVVMEARIRSGSLTTVHHALNQGKDVFVFPGDPLSEQFSGNHTLLREGARFFTTAEQILEDMNWLDNPVEVGQNSEGEQAGVSWSPAEKKILDSLKRGNLSFEQLCVTTGMASPEMMSTLTMLQIRGALEALPGKVYQLRV